MNKKTKRLISFFILYSAIALMITACNMPTPTPSMGGGHASSSWYVSPSGDDANACSIPSEACFTINGALDKASSGDTVYLASGTYTNDPLDFSMGPRGGRTLALVDIQKPITLIGTGPATTILDGSGVHAVMTISTTGSVRIIDLTIANGGSSPYETFGGGVIIFDPCGVVHMTNVHITNNRRETSIYGGAGVYNICRLEMSDVEVTGNQLNNTEVHSGQGAGGGIYNNGFLVINRGNISQNSNPNWYGGGIYNNSNGTAMLSDVTIDRNSAGALGSGIFNKGFMEIQRSTISYNVSAGGDINAGDGIANYGSPAEGEEYAMRIINSTISNNEQAGLRISAATYVDFSTITENRFGEIGAPTDGGFALIKNTIIVGNIDFDYEDRLVALLPGYYASFHNLMGRAAHSPQFGAEVTDAGLLPLGDNGGFTLTHALQPDSVARDAARTADCLTFDQRSHPRATFVGDPCDIGAYEYDLLDDAETTSLEITGTPEFSTATPAPDNQPQESQTNTDTLCWKGPGAAYEVVSSILANTKLELIGRGEEGNWLVVNNPVYRVPCWLPQEDVTVDPNFDISTLATMPAPPLPTPTSAPPTATLPPAAPNAPANLAATTTTCNAQDYAVTLNWFDASGNEAGFKILRDGVEIAATSLNVSQYVDHPPYSGPHSYTVIAYNASGNASSGTTQDSGCIY